MSIGTGGISDNNISRLDQFKVGAITLGTLLALIATVSYIISSYQQGQLMKLQTMQLNAQGYQNDDFISNTVADIEKLLDINQAVATTPTVQSTAQTTNTNT
jgi:hypothetical protein